MMKDKLKIKSFSFLPFVKSASELPLDGILQAVPNFCKNKFDEKCKLHYAKCNDGYSQCPHGYSTYKTTRSGESLIWTCLKVKGSFDKVAQQIRSSSQSNKIFSTEEIDKLFTQNNDLLNNLNTSLDLKLSKAKESVEVSLEYTKNAFHEIKPLNAEIKAACNRLKSKIGQLKENLQDNDFRALEAEINKVAQSANLISTRMEMRDFLINPISAKLSSTRTFQLKKESQKLFLTFKSKMKKEQINLNVSIDSSRNVESYDIFPIALFVIIENAVKYSPSNIDQEIEITDEILEQSYFYKVTSLGPKIEVSETALIFDSLYRGVKAREHDGSGVGLFLANKICQTLEYEISVNQDQNSRITFNNYDYFKTCFKISIPKKYLKIT